MEHLMFDDFAGVNIEAQHAIQRTSVRCRRTILAMHQNRRLFPRGRGLSTRSHRRPAPASATMQDRSALCVVRAISAATLPESDGIGSPSLHRP